MENQTGPSGPSSSEKQSTTNTYPIAQLQQAIGLNYENDPTYQILKKLIDENTELQKKYTNQTDQLDLIKKKLIEDVKNVEGELTGKIEDGKLKIIETLGIFVALFTFVSIDFQVFRTYQDPQMIAGLTLILLGSLLTFITILDFVLNVRLPITKIRNEEEIEFNWFDSKTWGSSVKVKFLPLTTIWLLLIIGGVWLFISAPKIITKNYSIYKSDNQFLPTNK